MRIIVIRYCTRQVERIVEDAECEGGRVVDGWWPVAGGWWLGGWWLVVIEEDAYLFPLSLSLSLSPPPPPLSAVRSLWLMSSDGFSKKRRRSSSNDDDDTHHQNSKRAPSADYNPTTLNPSPTLDTNSAVPTTPVILDSSTPGDSMPDDDYVHHSFTAPPTGAPPATTHVQPTPPLSASKPDRDAPYVGPLQKWDQISSLKFTAMKDGDIWYLISLAWYEKWRAACNPASKTQGREADEQLGPVDNSDIVDPDGELIPALSDGNRVTSVSQRVMELFIEWYFLLCISPLCPAYTPPIAGMVLQGIPSREESSPRAISPQSASNSILTR